MEWSYNDNKKSIIIDKLPKNHLKISGHRLSSVLGVNKYQTAFGAWCEITKLAKLPFEDNKYTLAGKAIEPKLIKYVSQFYPNVKSIEDYYGNIFDEYRYDNFKEESKIFSGVMDAVATLNDGKTLTMICECKTSSKPQDWVNNQPPADYQLQGALYAYLKGLDRVLFACSFLTDLDYANPENYVVNESNTILVVKKLSDILIPIGDRYLNIKECIEYATEWWKKYIENGISPEFDEIKDKEYLSIIRASKPCEDNELIDVCEEAIKLAKEIKDLEVSSGLKAKQDLLKTLEANIKDKMIEQELSTTGKYKLTKTTSKKFDEKKLEKDNPILYNKYVSETINYKLTKDMKEEEENENN